MNTPQSLTLAALVATVTAQSVKLEARFSDNMLNVGNVDLFAATWQAIYSAQGNDKGVVIDDAYDAITNSCTHYTDEDPDVAVRVQINGAWGSVADVGGPAMRDALTTTLWEIVKQTSDPNEYQIFTQCAGFTWSESVAQVETAACGPIATAGTCDAACESVSSSLGLTQCDVMGWGHSVPSQIRITAYDDVGRLLADDIIIEFTATDLTPEAGGCGLVGPVTSYMAGFIPYVGTLFAAGVDVLCEN